MINSNPRCQRGAVLFITLILLVAVMLLGVMMSGLARSNLQIVRNNQSEQQRTGLAQRAVEQVLNDINNFTSPTAPMTGGATVMTQGVRVRMLNGSCV